MHDGTGKQDFFPLSLVKIAPAEYSSTEIWSVFACLVSHSLIQANVGYIGSHGYSKEQILKCECEEKLGMILW